VTPLVRYDYEKGCFVLAGEKKNYWPGTSLVKSTNNVFNWRQKQHEVPSVRRVEHR
jgi:hypothetical protein